jgi:hypothetical protein
LVLEVTCQVTVCEVHAGTAVLVVGLPIFVGDILLETNGIDFYQGLCTQRRSLSCTIPIYSRAVFFGCSKCDCWGNHLSPCTTTETSYPGIPCPEKVGPTPANHSTRTRSGKKSRAFSRAIMTSLSWKA